MDAHIHLEENTKAEQGMAGRIDAHGLSDIGLVREHNEDQFLIADLKKSVIIHQTSLSYDDETHMMGGSQAKLFLVADGRSDDVAGERASRTAVQSIVQYLLNTMHWLFRLDDGHEGEFLEDLRSAVRSTQDRIQHTLKTEPAARLGTTITMAYIVWPQLYLIHAGSSSAFVIRNHKSIRLTHSADSTGFTGAGPEQRTASSPLHRVFSGLMDSGTEPLQPEITQFTLQLHDKLLLCTDGVTDQVSEARIVSILSVDTTAENGCRALVNAAAEAGGSDNATVVLACFTDGHRELMLQAEALNTETRQEELVPKS